MSKLVEVNEKIAEAVVEGYKKVLLKDIRRLKKVLLMVSTR